MSGPGNPTRPRPRPVRRDGGGLRRGPFLRRARSAGVLALVAVAGLAGCQGTVADPPPATPFELQVEAERITPVPAFGDAATLDVGTWNLEWFGDPGNGPADEARQLANVARIMAGLAVDLWSVQEVTSPAHFQALVDSLDGYAGLLANDPAVADGPAYYNDYGGNEQKVGLIYRPDAATVDSARVILTDHDHAFAGRPPVEVHLTVSDQGPPGRLVMILLHAKAGADAEDRERREAGATALKQYLDATYPDRRVLVAGDFNDDVDTSIDAGAASPYAAFVADSAHYGFPTASLSAARVSSTVDYPDLIDHQLATDELLTLYLQGSAAVFPADRYLARYDETTTDHYPVLARYGDSSALTAATAPATAPPSAPATAPAILGRADLAWTGARSDRVGIYRDGALIAVTANDGVHVDTVTLSDGDALSYRLCEAGTETCSNAATARF